MCRIHPENYLIDIIKRMKSLIVIASLIACISAWSRTSQANNPGLAAPEWDGLRVTYGAFSELPRIVEQAMQSGWVLDQTAGGCGVPGTKFNGNRYILNQDPAVMLLFDRNGYIAGIQAGIPKNRTDEYPGPQNRKYNVFNEEEDKWVITAYFVEPAGICTNGRRQMDFDRDGTGYKLTIQTGPSAYSLMTIPKLESQVLMKTNFIEGRCYYSMGKHYSYNSTEDMSCDDTFPVFLLYNKGVLNAFGWAFNIKFETSRRWENPSKATFDKFMVTPPKCLGRTEPLTTLHIYMTSNPSLNKC